MYKLHYVVDVDIKGFFDNVDHGKLIKQLWTIGIQDKRVLAIISKMLKAEIQLTKGKIEKPMKGTPQGGILSPLLANVVLNELDWWIASQWELFPAKDFVEKERPDGKGTNRTSKYAKLRRKSKLKQCYIVRYADDFKIFCPDFQTAKSMKYATKDFLEKRLKLQISEEKSKITNLRKNYSEFLGFKFKVYQKGDKWVIISHMSDKAKQRSLVKLKLAMNKIKNTEGTANTERAISEYNSIVYGMHQYFRLATMISEDVGDISYQIQHKCKSRRLKRRIKTTGKTTPMYIQKEYGKSKQLRYINGTAIIPIGYCKTKNPMYKKKTVNKYTSEGREETHKMLAINNSMIKYLIKNPVENRSIEYNDNRISKYSAQRGRCYVSGIELTSDNLRCHHIKPLQQGGGDEYKNLVLVTEQIHILIHAVNEETIGKYIKILDLDKRAMAKLNTLRSKANNKVIKLEDYIF
jgi:group II intron reverse transcriptase/maturase